MKSYLPHILLFLVTCLPILLRASNWEYKHRPLTLLQAKKINHEEVTAKFGMRLFRVKNKVHCKHCEAMYKYNTTSTPMMYHYNNMHLTQWILLSTYHQLNLSTEELRCTTSRENYPRYLQIDWDGYASHKCWGQRFKRPEFNWTSISHFITIYHHQICRKLTRNNWSRSC